MEEGNYVNKSKNKNLDTNPESSTNTLKKGVIKKIRTEDKTRKVINLKSFEYNIKGVRNMEKSNHKEKQLYQKNYHKCSIKSENHHNKCIRQITGKIQDMNEQNNNHNNEKNSENN